MKLRNALKSRLLWLMIITCFAVGAVFGFQRWQAWQLDTQAKKASEGGKYLVIKEWGVRFPLPKELRGDVRYEIRPYFTGKDVPVETAWFEVVSVAKLPGSNCT